MTPPRRTNGSSVTRAELGAHLERIDHRLAAIERRIEDIAKSVLAPRRWLYSRLTTVVDRGLILAVSAVLAYIATHS